MSRLEQILMRLPSLYRPEASDKDLLPWFLQNVAAVLEEINTELSQILQSHWFRFADRPLYHSYVRIGRKLQGLAPLKAGDLIDISDPINFPLALRDALDPFAAYLRDRLSPGLRQLLEAYDGSVPAPEELLRGLIEELSTLIKSDWLYEEARFAQVTLSDEVKGLIAQRPVGNGLIFLNQILLEQAFPNQVSRSLVDFPYIDDLARLGGLLGLPPWQEPAALRETVEAYRLRLERTIRLYQDGLGTRKAIHHMVEAQLPVNLLDLPEHRDRPFWLEEFAPLIKDSLAVAMQGEPTDLVGPLMRWTMINDGFEPVPPTVYIQGIEPQEGLTEATINPLLELYQYGETFPRLGLAYGKTVTPGETLRLQPAYTSWLGLESGIQRAESRPMDKSPADPTAPGPWLAVPESPEEPVLAIHQTLDRIMWVATDTGNLWRYNGRKWSRALENTEILCLADDGEDLLIGTKSGLLRLALYPKDPAAALPREVTGLSGQQVWTIYPADEDLWVGTDQGAGRLMAQDTYEAAALQGVPVYAISQDHTGVLHFGTKVGLMQHQPTTNRWYWLAKSGSTAARPTEQESEWQSLTPGKLPSAEEIPIPVVTCVHRGPDASVWIGTDRGPARYIARSVRDLAYETLIEAFPDICAGRVYTIKEDALGLIWFGTERGLFRFDGRDWWQLQASAWKQLGRAELLYKLPPVPRGTWRFDHTASAWQRFNKETDKWENFTEAPRTRAEPAVRVVYWTDQVAADLGDWDGSHFTVKKTVEATDFLMRYKPDESRIVDGGIAAIPRLPVGSSVWRYLSYDPDEVVATPSRPLWTREGKLLPPPVDLPARPPGRWDSTTPPPTHFDQAVFVFKPAARVWFEWEATRPLTVLVRLKKRTPDDYWEPAILDRVWQGIEQVRPAGIRAVMAVEEEILRG